MTDTPDSVAGIAVEPLFQDAFETHQINQGMYSMIYDGVLFHDLVLYFMAIF